MSGNVSTPENNIIRRKGSQMVEIDLIIGSGSE
jgi:hypothetical protein